MIEVIPFQVDHLEIIGGRDYERRFQRWIDTPSILEIPELSWSGIGPRGTMIAAGGFLPILHGVAEGWMFFGEEMRTGQPGRVWAALALEAKRRIEHAMETQFHRIQTTIPAAFEPGLAFATHLGLTEEGLLRKYGPEMDDFIMLSRTR
jgi:hypothetical protein